MWTSKPNKNSWKITIHLQVISIFLQKWVDLWSVSLNSIYVTVKLVDESLNFVCVIGQLFTHLANFFFDDGADVDDGIVDVRLNLEWKKLVNRSAREVLNFISINLTLSSCFWPPLTFFSISLFTRSVMSLIRRATSGSWRESNCLARARS